MKAIGRLFKPEYVYRPKQFYLRVVRGFRRETRCVDLRLPWGTSIYVHPEHHIGRAIWHLGLYDLAVTEALWRLVDSGELAVDIGANIGYMTGVMAVRAGASGRGGPLGAATSGLPKASAECRAMAGQSGHRH